MARELGLSFYPNQDLQFGGLSEAGNSWSVLGYARTI